jgi:5-methylcytosine-specific restriction endonuclease McrA
LQYLAQEIFTSLSTDMRALTYSATQNDAALADKYSLPLTPTFIENLTSTLPPSVSDSLTTYALLPEHCSLTYFLTPVFTAYISATTAPPPIWSQTRATSCELCTRSWINLTYHHLIPKAVHAKVLKRGWHEEWELNKVAWLCRACHSFVHRVATNEELAKDFYSVERLAEREDVGAFVKWVGRVRWKPR